MNNGFLINLVKPTMDLRDKGYVSLFLEKELTSQNKLGKMLFP
jgi:hypothetical protein